MVVSQAPPGRAKCPADPHARRRPKQKTEGREPAAAGHEDRVAILAGAAVSPPGPRRIIAQMLGACSIQADRSQHHLVPAVLQCEYLEKSLLTVCWTRKPLLWSMDFKIHPD